MIPERGKAHLQRIVCRILQKINAAAIGSLMTYNCLSHFIIIIIIIIIITQIKSLVRTKGQN